MTQTAHVRSVTLLPFLAKFSNRVPGLRKSTPWRSRQHGGHQNSLSESESQARCRKCAALDRGWLCEGCRRTAPTFVCMLLPAPKNLQVVPFPRRSKPCPLPLCATFSCYDGGNADLMCSRQSSKLSYTRLHGSRLHVMQAHEWIRPHCHSGNVTAL